MCDPATLLVLTETELTQLHHNCLLELLRRYPPTWPSSPAYNLARRLFETTMELHQALGSHDITPRKAQAVTAHLDAIRPRCEPHDTDPAP